MNFHSVGLIRGIFIFIFYLFAAPLTPKQVAEISEMNIVNAGKNYDVGPMLNKTIEKLNEFYKPFNDRLARLLKEERWTWDDQRK
jgi:hypothetical protein